MATADEILAGAVEVASEDVTQDKVLRIDNELRTISIPSAVKLLGVESDEDVNVIEFEMPRYYGEFDLSEFSVRVNYLNANGEGDIYKVTDPSVGEQTMTFSWLVGRFASAYKGTVQFIVCLKKLTEELVVEKEFNTTIASLPVLQGLEPSEQVLQNYPDIIEQILKYMETPVSSEEIGKAVEEYLKENPVGGATINDEEVSAGSVWSSQKTSSQIDEKVSNHNTDQTTHADIRNLIIGLTNRLNALADSDDTTLDQLSEIVAYIKSNKELIDAITTSKVSVGDIVDNLSTNATNKPLSAAQGVRLKELIDEIVIPSALKNPQPIIINGVSYDGSEKKEITIQASDGGITQETDPTVPSWAKQVNKPVYTADEVGADPAGTALSNISDHNASSTAHTDIRQLIVGLTNRLNALADSDDTTLDQLSEIVAYIKSNKSLIDNITTGKVSVSDIVDDLVTNSSNKPLSAAQGVKLKALIDAIVPVTVDAALSSTSTNPVQNKVVFSALNEVKPPIDDAVTAEDKLWSSKKTSTELSTLSQQKVDKEGWTAGKNVVTDADGNITTEDKPTIPSALPNPYSLMINNQEYNGSESVNVSIETGAEIDDTNVSAETTYSSQKIEAELSALSPAFFIDNNTVYEDPSFPEYPTSASSTTYTTPADGLFYMYAIRGDKSGNTLKFEVLKSNGTLVSRMSFPAYNPYATLTMLVPIAKGLKIKFTTDTTSNTWRLTGKRFFYKK